MTATAIPSSRQGEFLAFIRDFWRRHGYGPTLREIGAALDVRSPNGVRVQLQSLAGKGLVAWMPKKARSLRVTERPGRASLSPAVCDLLRDCDRLAAWYDEQTVLSGGEFKDIRRRIADALGGEK